MSKNSQLSITDVLELIKGFGPIKIVYNNVVLYNDYDSTEESKDGIIGETEPYQTAIEKRLYPMLKDNNIIISSVEIKIVHFHHSIVYLTGEKEPK